MDDKSKVKPIHYHGDTVRILFLVAAGIMLVSLPLVQSKVFLPSFLSVVAIVILTLAAGITNPKLVWTAQANCAISVLAFLVFDTEAVLAFRAETFDSIFFGANFILGFIFLFATYYSVKTLRGFMLQSTEPTQ